jgi:hypothetical protein
MHSNSSNRKWRKLQQQIEMLRRRKIRYGVPIPDLSVPQIRACTSNVIAVPGHWTPARTKLIGAKQFAVGHSHKQGLELLTPDMIKTALPAMGGNKT